MSNLFSSISVGGLTVKNRIVMPPMVCFGYSGEDGIPTEKNLSHYEARARGGVGLIIIEATCVSKIGRLANMQLGLWADNQVEGFTKIARACKPFGATILVQIHHAGLGAPKSVTTDPVAPSDYHGQARFGGGISARALTSHEIHRIQDEFVAAAVGAKKAGLDGVELHGAHGYLISQFLSPEINQRRDSYGGSLENRSRFAAEIIAKIKAAAGKGFIIGCRMGCNEPDLESSIAIAKILEKSGVDLLHVSSGMTTLFSAEPEVPFPVPPDFNYSWITYGASQVKRNVGVPVIAVNGIRTPAQAAYLVENNLADFTSIGKGLLVDAEWANKAQQNREVTTCIDCKVCAYFRPGATCPPTGAKPHP